MRSIEPSAHHFLLLLLLLPISCAGALSISSGAARRFYVLRHGQTNYNALGIIQGSSDVSRLTSLGKEQATLVGRTAFCPVATESSTKRVRSIYVSPLTRARETLSLLRQSAPPNILPPSNTERVLSGLREIDFYSWENRFKEELMEEHPEEYAAWKAGDPDRLVVDGRRPLWETWQRAGEVWGEIRSELRMVASEDGRNGEEEDEAATLLVCHGTLGQALLGSAFGLDATVFRTNKFPNCGMAEILWHDEDEKAKNWRWIYPSPTDHGCLRKQLGFSV